MREGLQRELQFEPGTLRASRRGRPETRRSDRPHPRVSTRADDRGLRGKVLGDSEPTQEPRNHAIARDPRRVREAGRIGRACGAARPHVKTLLQRDPLPLGPQPRRRTRPMPPPARAPKEERLFRTNAGPSRSGGGAPELVGGPLRLAPAGRITDAAAPCGRRRGHSIEVESPRRARRSRERPRNPAQARPTARERSIAPPSTPPRDLPMA